jgi:hypothetical protein
MLYHLQRWTSLYSIGHFLPGIVVICLVYKEFHSYGYAELVTTKEHSWSRRDLNPQSQPQPSQGYVLPTLCLICTLGYSKYASGVTLLTYML